MEEVRIYVCRARAYVLVDWLTGRRCMRGLRLVGVEHSPYVEGIDPSES